MKNTTKIIGLTGNIATGKSVVRCMLENSGALGMDADTIAHRMLYPGGPAFNTVVETFGEKILSKDRLISHAKLGEIVFSDPGKLAKLEALVHPEVTKSIQRRVRESKKPFVVIEAIKLIEAGLGEICDAIWVSHASKTHQLERLLQTRKMSESKAMIRIRAQPPQSTKFKLADVIINTEADYKHTWQQIQRALNDTIKSSKDIKPAHTKITEGWITQSASDLFEKQLEKFWQAHSHEDISTLYESLGFQEVLTISENGHLIALVLWENWNFTAALNRLIPAKILKISTAQWVEAFQSHTRRNQCEILFLPEKIFMDYDLKPKTFGFHRQQIDKISYPAWRRAGEKFTPDHKNHIWIKILSQPVI
jgi:dephospho-CoA kinase